MKSKNLIFIALIFFAFNSCDNKKPATDSLESKDSTASKAASVEKLPIFKYKRATYYAGVVDFYFEDSTGKEVEVRVSHAPEDSGAIYPDYLLESGDSIEGPPGANPALIGKNFLLIKNAKGKIVEIRPTN